MLTAVSSDAGPAAPTEAPPSPELLLYLGEFEDASGEFVDPMSLEEQTELPATDAPPATPPPQDEDRDEPAPNSA